MTSYSTDLDIALLDSNATAPEDVVNDAIQALDSKTTGTVVCAFATNTLSLTQDQQALGSIFHATAGSPGPTGNCTLTFASFGLGPFAVINDTGFPLALEYSGQVLPAPVLDDGSVGVFCGDGSNVRTAVAGSAGSAGIVAAVQASEDLLAGAIVNVWNSGGARMRNANASDGTKPAHGFVMNAVSSGNIGIMFGSGQINNKVTGMTPGADQYLDTSSGGINATAPSGTGQLVQYLGVAISATQLAFVVQQGILLP